MDGLNAGYAAVLLDDYLENPGAVPEEWRKLFEQAGSELLAAGHPGLARLLAAAEPSAGRPATPLPQPPVAPAALDEELLGGVAAAMALVKAYRMHGHLAARLDPLGSEPIGDPALDETRLVPPLTPELQARIPASLLRLYVAGRDAARGAAAAARRLHAGRSPTRSSTSPTTPSASGCGRRSSRAASAQPLAAGRAARAARAALRRSRASSSTCAARSSARSSSRSRVSTCSCRCSTRRSSSPPRAARTRS